MRLNLLQSGSDGNCAILSDDSGNQVILDCGIKYEKLAPILNWDKPISVLISHKHTDHYNEHTVNKLRFFGVEILDEQHFLANKMFSVADWRVFPMELPHTADMNSWAFLLFHVKQNKKMFFATDCRLLPTFQCGDIDLIMVENNYSERKVMENICSSSLKNTGFRNHLSSEYVLQWLSARKCMCKNLLITHLSNSGNIDVPMIKDLYEGLADNIYIATKEMSIIF